jgi:uncharacterized membrane protein YhhN
VADGRWVGGVAIAVAAADTALAGSAAPWARRARRVTKPALVPAITAAVRARGGRPSGLQVVALTGSWAGDVALLSRSDAGLLGGIGGFAVAHVAYLAEIRRRTPGPTRSGPAWSGPAWSGAAWSGAGAAAAGAALAGSVLWRRLDTAGQRRLRMPVLGYAGLVTAMGAAAVRAGRRTPGPAGRALAAGGPLFVLSDGLVAAGLVGPRRRSVDAAVMATYATAQALLAAALADRGPGPDRRSPAEVARRARRAVP